MTAGGTCPHLSAEERHAIAVAVRGAACHDATVQAMLVSRLLEGNASDLRTLRKAVALRDWPTVQRSLHRIKGSAALARCNTLVTAGKSLESAAGQGNAAVVNTLLPRYTAILKEFDDTLLALRPAQCQCADAHTPGASPSTKVK
ncbi:MULTISPECIES: Hpt domain-containing protein [unclassified Cupriavidus]|uniref:Hpt domain-containing protein n=1 Tax=unclassified Cupriavidus TaxID=2640874 RepID=UPI001C004F27|nr:MULTISPECIES: Hpt domain-containing protein [unclassified Cupriavidus]MCA3183767.1 Hpt domain-containing protein [Cupriavidus sp.]MCA3193566.1 Hpt domain-containing protein [Cupriavidus sp.]MCA3198974.1 Hpt domain-containing protein [Cupriavidus sp.]MCA3203443.1 Hpt domain-containing protein [Cupriavidus sp.]MCA3209552.1 Hpt domain-containing protein [Cupriavidus sp.]